MSDGTQQLLGRWPGQQREGTEGTVSFFHVFSPGQSPEGTIHLQDEPPYFTGGFLQGVPLPCILVDQIKSH